MVIDYSPATLAIDESHGHNDGDDFLDARLHQDQSHSLRGRGGNTSVL